MFLSDVRIIDMRRTGIPKEQWKKLQNAKQLPENWHEIRKYVPYDYKIDASIRPDYKFTWNRNVERHIKAWQVKWNYSLVTVNDGYWPEGVRSNGEGHYEFGDLVLMKISLEDFIAKRKPEIEASNRQAAAELKRFEGERKKLGADVDDEILHRLIGI